MKFTKRDADAWRLGFDEASVLLAHRFSDACARLDSRTSADLFAMLFGRRAPTEWPGDKAGWPDGRGRAK